MNDDNRYPIFPRMVDFKREIDKYLETHPEPDQPITEDYKVQAEEEYNKLEDRLEAMQRDNEANTPSSETIDPQEWRLFQAKVRELRHRVQLILNAATYAGGRRKKTKRVFRETRRQKRNRKSTGRRRHR